MTTTKTPPPFTVRADELDAGDFIVLPSLTPVPRPIVARVLTVKYVGDDVILSTTYGETTTSVGSLVTCLGTVLEIR